jgi:hypothetical protein
VTINAMTGQYEDADGTLTQLIAAKVRLHVRPIGIGC